MKFTVPKPPSTNHIYGLTSRGGFARSYITQKGKAWFEEAGYIVNTQKQGVKTLSCFLAVTINLFTAYFTLQDVDGIVKPTLDLLEKQGIYENDALVIDLRVRKYKTTKPHEHLEIEVIPLDSSTPNLI